MHQWLLQVTNKDQLTTGYFDVVHRPVRKIGNWPKDSGDEELNLKLIRIKHKMFKRKHLIFLFHHQLFA